MARVLLRARMASSPLNIPGRNHLLGLLPAPDRERLERSMERLETAPGDVLFRNNAPITHVDFPLRGVVSIIIIMENGGIAEVGTVGNEGMAGVPLLLGADRSPARAFHQFAGEVLRMPADVFREEIAAPGIFSNVLRRYAQAFLNQVSHSAACNRLHEVEQRLSRWILMAHDRTDGDRIALTQEFMSQMLGVRRASVSVAAAKLQRAGLIQYRRGMLEVLDRAGIEAHACECYRVVQQEFERLLHHAP